MMALVEGRVEHSVARVVVIFKSPLPCFGGISICKNDVESKEIQGGGGVERGSALLFFKVGGGDGGGLVGGPRQPAPSLLPVMYPTARSNGGRVVIDVSYRMAFFAQSSPPTTRPLAVCSCTLSALAVGKGSDPKKLKHGPHHA